MFRLQAKRVLGLNICYLTYKGKSVGGACTRDAECVTSSTCVNSVCSCLDSEFLDATTAACMTSKVILIESLQQDVNTIY